ncbi:cytochrome P450 [Streptomyces sp. ISID311]|uniref:cytochrome P450 n=1 Tax=Streptomyces sp. ISID311 TaxID=2601673 RepID=UPI0011BD4315|nr:cytochrome P450 [Streptomyces sp. ISID311]TXC98561.1 cytochrome P450 [Streptomyces sp. ISID311]
MTGPTDGGTPPAFPFPRTCPYRLPAEYNGLRESGPVSKVTLPTGKPAWILTRYDDVRKALLDPHLSSDRADPNFPMLVELARSDKDSTLSLAGMDAPEHTRARRAVVGEFTFRRMEALRPRVQEIVDECVDAMLAGPNPADLVKTMSFPVPSLVICELLGVSVADRDFFEDRTSRMLSMTLPPLTRQQAFFDLQTYLDELVTAKEKAPGEDLLSRQIAKGRKDSAYDHDALVDLAFLLLTAGHDTTGNMISLGMLALMETPELRARITGDPSTTPQVVEELLRYFTITDIITTRVAKEDVEIGGQTIRAGEGVFALGGSANHDPDVFENPGKLDVDRGARQHLAFGHGPHQCLGQSLARMELEIVYDTLLRRIPGLRPAGPAEDLPLKNDAAIFGLHELPVTW